MSTQTFGKSLLIVLAFSMTCSWQSRAFSDDYTLIISGSGGTEEYQKKFVDWGSRLRTVLTEKLGHEEDKVVWLAESGIEGATCVEESTLENVRHQISSLVESVTTSDQVFIYLIGHGSYFYEELKFHIPGSDLTAQELNDLISRLHPRNLVLINAASSSAGFINILSGEGRIICTSTKSVQEDNATEFMEFFLQSLEEESADLDHDERITVYEACKQAAVLTEAWYVTSGFLATEHALIDDNGDALGTRLVPDITEDSETGKSQEQTEEENSAKPEEDGTLASRVFLKEFVFPPDTPEDLIEQYKHLLTQVEDLKARKGELEEKQYYKQLEILLVQAAQANRKIRSYASREISDATDGEQEKL